MKWKYPINEMPAISMQVLVKYKSADYGEQIFVSHHTQDWWIRNIEKWLDESAEETNDEGMIDFGNFCRARSTEAAYTEELLELYYKTKIPSLDKGAS